MSRITSTISTDLRHGHHDVRQPLPAAARSEAGLRRRKSSKVTARYSAHTSTGSLKQEQMASSQPLKISGDPRRPQEAQPYVPPLKDEEQPGDFRLIGAMMLGLAAMLTKIPWFGWAGILLNLNYFAHMKSSEFDLKATMSALFFSISGLVGSYLTRPLA